jgi:hypothetical protein
MVMFITRSIVLVYREANILEFLEPWVTNPLTIAIVLGAALSLNYTQINAVAVKLAKREIKKIAFERFK